MEVKELSPLADALSKASKDLKAKAAPQVDVTKSSVDVTSSSGTTTEEVKQPEAVVEPPKEQPKEETKQPEVKTEEPVVELNWDDEPIEQQPKAETLNFEKIGSALKLEGIKDEATLVNKFNELNTQLSEYKQRSANLDSVPNELKEVLEVATKGGDWKSYLGVSTVDYSKVDPVEAFRYEASKDPRFKNTDGTLNKEAFDDAMDAIPDALKSFHGQQILNGKINEQQQLKIAQIQAAERRREESDRQLAQATKNLSEILPVNQYGIKFEPKHSESLYKGISDGSLLQKHFLNEKGEYDMKKVAKTIAMAEWGDKMIKFQFEKAKTQAKKEILTKTQNVQIDPSKKSVTPEQKQEKPLSPQERMVKFVEGQKKVGQL